MLGLLIIMALLIFCVGSSSSRLLCSVTRVVPRCWTLTILCSLGSSVCWLPRMTQTNTEAIDYPCPTTNTPSLTIHHALIVFEAVRRVCTWDDDRDAKEDDWSDASDQLRLVLCFWRLTANIWAHACLAMKKRTCKILVVKVAPIVKNSHVKSFDLLVACLRLILCYVYCHFSVFDDW